METKHDDLVYFDAYQRNGGGLTKREYFALSILCSIATSSTLTAKIPTAIDATNKLIEALNEEQKA